MALTSFFGELGRDAGHAFRLLRRTPGYAAVSVATLAAGIGASTAIFTVVDSVLLRPLRFAEPHRLVMVRPSSGSRVSDRYLHEWRRQSRTLQDMTGWQDVRVNLTGEGPPVEVLADRVTPNFFAMLGTSATLGRTFAFAGDLNQVDPEVVLSYGFWQRQYRGDPDVVGRPVTLDGEHLTIVGVMPEGFTIRTNELSESRAELWIPFRLTPEGGAGMGGSLNVVARLAPGVARDQAQAELSVIARRLEAAYPSYTRDWGVGLVPLHEATVRDVRTVLLVLFGGVAILLLLACANVANLTLSHAVARQRELATRLAVGATTGRLVRQFLTESVVLAGVGGMLGVLVALWGTQLLVAAVPAGVDLPRTREIGVDLRILVFACAITILTAILFGLIPSIVSARSAALPALRATTRGSAGGGSRIESALIVSQVALAVLLLAGAGLLGRSFRELTRVQPGFQPEGVLTMRTTLPAAKYASDDRIRAFSSELLERIGDLPGVLAAGSVNYLPLSNFGTASVFRIEGRPEVRPADRPGSWTSVVGGGYFEAMGIPLLRGRLPGAADTATTQPVFVIDDELARRYWPDTDPLGARLVWGTDEHQKRSGVVVGIVGSVRWVGIATNPQPTTYFWLPQNPDRELTFVARTVGNPAAWAGLVADQVRAIDPEQPVAGIRPMQDLVAADLARTRFTMLLLGCFAAAALLMAAIGVYGVIAFAVAQRTREIGIRVALGAQYRDVLHLVMRRGVLLAGAGVVIGIVSALAIGRFVTALLYGITPRDPATLAAVALLLVAVALVATYVPARRVVRVDPAVALRTE